MIYNIFRNAFIQTFFDYFMVQLIQQIMLSYPFIYHSQLSVFRCTFSNALPNHFFIIHAYEIVDEIKEKQLHGIPHIKPISDLWPGYELSMLYNCNFHNFLNLLSEYPLQKPITDIILYSLLCTHQNLIAVRLIFDVSKVLQNYLARLSINNIGNYEIQYGFGQQILLEFERIHLTSHQETSYQCLHFSEPWQSEFHHYLFGLFILQNCGFQC